MMKADDVCLTEPSFVETAAGKTEEDVYIDAMCRAWEDAEFGRLSIQSDRLEHAAGFRFK